MRPKRPDRPPAPPPPIPSVVTPENLDAINTPEVDKLPAYISPGKFQWKPPEPGPKGDQGEPGVTVRPITPPIETAEIADEAVGNGQLASASITPDKLSAVAPPTDGQFPAYNQAQAKFEWKVPTSAPTGSIITLVTPIVFMTNLNTTDLLQMFTFSEQIPETATALLVQIRHTNLSGAPLAAQAIAAAIASPSDTVGRVIARLNPGSPDNFIADGYGLTPLSTGGSPRMYWSVVRAGVQTQVEIILAGYIT